MDYRQAAIDAARKYGIDPDMFVRLIQQESSFRPNVVSPKGAIGLGQLMPATAQELGVDPRDPLQNLEGAAKYFSQQLKRFGSPELALAAYNAGPTRVAGLGRVPNIAETQNYVKTILGEGQTTMATPMDRAREEQLRMQMLASGTAPQAAPRAPLSALRQDRPQAAAAPQQRRGGLGGIMDYLGKQSPTTGLSRAEQFAAALDPLIMPEMRAGEAIRARGAQRQAAAKRNKTIEYLEKYSPEAADLMRGGLLNASEALKISRDTEARSLAKRASEALQSGDMQTAMAILTQLSPTAMGQQIAAQAVKPPSEILGGGKYTVTYPEGRSGEPVITINEDVVAAEQRIAQAEREARREATGLPTDARKAEEADFEAITAIDNLMQDISGIIGDFGYDPETKEFTGPLDIGLSGFLKGAFGSIGVGGQGAIETAKARDEFERFKTRLVNTSLRLNKGVQTEGDAQRAAKELGDARTEATAYAAIQELLRINQRARDNRSAAIARRRERFKLDPVKVPEGTAPDLKWSIK
jgi:hypothetical protein